MSPNDPNNLLIVVSKIKMPSDRPFIRPVSPYKRFTDHGYVRPICGVGFAEAASGLRGMPKVENNSGVTKRMLAKLPSVRIWLRPSDSNRPNASAPRHGKSSDVRGVGHAG